MEEHWEMLKKEQVLRKKLHNQVEDMKGNNGEKGKDAAD